MKMSRSSPLASTRSVRSWSIGRNSVGLSGRSSGLRRLRLGTPEPNRPKGRNLKDENLPRLRPRPQPRERDALPDLQGAAAAKNTAMTLPADFAALRALVDAVAFHRRSLAGAYCLCKGCAAFRAAQEALERMAARLVQLEGALKEQRRQMGYPGLDPVFAATMVQMIDAALVRVCTDTARHIPTREACEKERTVWEDPGRPILVSATRWKEMMKK